MPTNCSHTIYRLYGIKNCDTVRKALAWLDTQGINYQWIDYKLPGVVATHLADWNTRVGWRQLLNPRSQAWKKIGHPSPQTLDEAAALQLMQQHPTLIKRPLLDTGHELIVGFDPARYNTLTKLNPPTKN